jgi:hypothetical protein
MISTNRDNNAKNSEFDIDLEWIDDSETKSQSQSKNSKIEYDADTLKRFRLEDNKFGKLIQYPLFVVIIVSVIFYLVFSLDKFYTLNWKEESLTTDESGYIDSFKKNADTYFWLFWYKFSNQWDTLSISLTWDIKSIKNQLNTYIINNDIWYIIKKDNINIFLNQFLQKYVIEKADLDKKNWDIIKYSFLPQEVDKLVSDNEIQRALLSIESIKFYTAMKIFSYLNSFVTEFSSSIWQNSSSVQKQMQYYLARWEWDTERYLKSCYLNVYESEECNIIWDFRNFYSTQWIDKKFYSDVFINLIRYIDNKLETDSFPKLSIVLNDLDPQKNILSFAIDINTYKEDEADMLMSDNLSSSNIKMPHVMIVTELLNSLRQSQFILWWSIELDNLKVNKKKVKQWNMEYTVNNSKFNFNIPVQKSTEREIYDFVYKK